jgi:hypothetical protein
MFAMGAATRIYVATGAPHTSLHERKFGETSMLMRPC